MTIEKTNMKKIRNIRQLKREQERLENKQRELEREMQESWWKIRNSITPQNVAKDLLNKLTSHGIGRLLQLFN